jgi:hypothetical protein
MGRTTALQHQTKRRFSCKSLFGVADEGQEFHSFVRILAELFEARIFAQRVPERIDPKIADRFAIGHYINFLRNSE